MASKGGDEGMTNYIIDPAVFYWINVLKYMQTMFALTGGFLLVMFIGLFCLYMYRNNGLTEPEKPDDVSDRYEMRHYQRELHDYENDMKDVQKIKKHMLITLIAGTLLILISIFIPDKQTSVEMLVARTATFDNVDWTVQQMKEIIDYIVSALNGVS